MDSREPVLADPEILPPASSPPKRPSRWAYAPATYALVAVNCLVFAGMVLGGVSAVSPQAEELIRWQANYGIAVLYGEWWRIVTATFVHVGIIHLATNMWCLWNLGLLGEPLLGPFGMLAVYILSGAGGNLLSVAVHPQAVGAGASGAVFGLAGVLIMLLKSPRLPIAPSELKGLRRSVIYFALLNFVIGGSTWLFHSSIQIDNMAHLGGFLSGLFLGALVIPRIGSERRYFLFRRRIGFAVVVAVLTLFAFYIDVVYSVRR
jgi:membrane associated rhomboid family serine protease